MTRGFVMGKPNYAVRYANLREKRASFADRRKTTVIEQMAIVDASLAEHAMVLKGPLHIDEKKRVDTLQRVKILQRNKEELLRELKRLDGIVLSDAPSQQELVREFYDIASAPSVYSATVGGVKLFLNVQARLELDGQRYNLGDWMMALDLSSDSLVTTQVRSGLKGEVKENGDHTSIQYAWSFGFCFGGNVGLIQDILNRGDYVTAVRVALTYMNDVNEDHKFFAPMMYKKAS